MLEEKNVHIEHRTPEAPPPRGLEIFVGYPIFPTALKYRVKRVRHSLKKSNNSPETHPRTVLADFSEVMEAIVKGCPSGRRRRGAGCL